MVSSFSLSIIFCCESLSCNDGSKLAIESLTPSASDLREEFLYMCSMNFREFTFLEYFSHCSPKIRLKRPCNEFIPFFYSQKLTKVNLTEFKLEFQSLIHERHENIYTKTTPTE